MHFNKPTGNFSFQPATVGAHKIPAKKKADSQNRNLTQTQNLMKQPAPGYSAEYFNS